MGNEKNLIPNSERTPSELREMTKKGGQASGAARRKKRDIKNILSTMLEQKTLDENGMEITQSEAMAATLIAISKDKTHKQCIQAQSLIYRLTGQDQTTEDKKKTKLILKQLEKDIELTQKKIDNADW